ncbi:Phytanoyl-CoA dioxygenase (PhyH) [Salinihabitans flavidus]|uniref:Phytanoyl-CoA dioxygenase (PhyH) n=1 Tax=Salinihabitans flavidus TaxID=569882 RepID=A0A1H8UB41_9RHOB|nr:phytanoyl-CoA dioxygenase family protein [Salinihabitans flavidus]SEP00073.1 Phytanoyl-CoA dioxygenase (PhyH) [Salinihabitans flavidus]
MVERALLTEDDIRTYREDGLVIPDYVLPDDVLERLRGAVDKLIADHAGIRPESLSGPHNPYGQSAKLMGNVDFLEFCQHPDILDMVEQLIGPDIILWGSMLFAKPPGDGKAVPWHQDGKYWPLEPLETITVRVSIDGSDRDNGCMQYIPGSHKSRNLEHHEVELREDMALGQKMTDLDTSKAKDCILKPGQISLHDVYTVHGSEHNRSIKRRADYAIRYMPATTLYDRSEDHPATIYANKHSPDMNYPLRPIWLVRGEDRAGNNFRAGKQ